MIVLSEAVAPTLTTPSLKLQVAVEGPKPTHTGYTKTITDKETIQK